MSNHITIIELLPYSTNVILRKITCKIKVLTLLEFILGHCLDAVTLIWQNKFEAFDAHVGDTCCQVRADYIRYISRSLKKSSLRKSFLKEQDLIIKYNEKVNEQLNNIRKKYVDRNPCYDKALDQKEKLGSFLEKLNLNINISNELAFLTSAFILSKFAKTDSRSIPYGINFDKLVNFLKISNTLAKNIVLKLQQFQSKVTCDFLYSLLNYYPENNIEKKLFHLLKKESDDHKIVFPCYEGMKIVMQDIKVNNSLVVLIIRQANVGLFNYLVLGCYFDSQQNKEVLIKNLDNIPHDTTCITIHGTSNMRLVESEDEYYAVLQKCGIMNILLANMARHPQFSGTTLSHLKENPYRELLKIKNTILSKRVKEAVNNYEIMRDLAGSIGACKENSSLFLVEHIFCSSVKNILTYTSGKNEPNILNTSSISHDGVNYYGRENH